LLWVDIVITGVDVVVFSEVDLAFVIVGLANIIEVVVEVDYFIVLIK